MDKNTKNQFDSLYLLYKNAWKNFHERRKYEWKFSIALWGAILTVIISLLSGKFDLFFKQHYTFAYYIIIVIFILIILYVHYNYILGISLNHKKDHNIAYYFEEKNAKLCNFDYSEMKLEIMKLEKREKKGGPDRASLRTQAGLLNREQVTSRHQATGRR